MKVIAFLKNLQDTLFSIIKIILRSKWVKKLPLVTEKDIVIFGNGPSLNSTLSSKEFLKGKDLLCVNAFALSSEYLKLKPKYYLLADPQFWSPVIKDMREYVQEISLSINKKTNWNIILLLPLNARKSVKKNNLFSNPCIKIHYFNKTTIQGFKIFRNVLYSWGLGMPMPQNVLIPSLITAITLKYKTIYVTGADHTWPLMLQVNDENHVSIRHKHFETTNKDLTKPRVIKNVTTGEPIKIHEQFEVLSIVFKNYHLINEYAKYKNVQIINISETSLIDAFKRQKI